MENAISTQQIALWRSAFNSLDYNAIGSLSYETIPELLKVIEQDFDVNTLKKYIQVVDSNETGQINFAQFLSLLRKLSSDEEEADKKELMEAFKLYDREGKGHIRASDFREILRNLDSTQTEEEIDDLITEYDTDGSGTIDLEEFLNAMATN